MRRGRLGKGKGINLFVAQHRAAIALQGQRIFIAQSLRRMVAAGGHRFIARAMKSRAVSRLQQRAAGDGFPHFGVGTGNEKTFNHVR